MAVCPDCGCRFDARTAERNRTPQPTDRRCEFCDDIFDTTDTNTWRRYCSRACQVAAYAERRKNAA